MNNKIITLYVPLFLLCIFALIVQYNMFIHKDVLYLVHLSQLMLEGNTYTHDFYEPSPPLIIYLYMPAVIFSKISSLNIIYTIPLYSIVLSFISLTISYFLLIRLIDNKIIFLFTLYILSVVLLLMPIWHYSQREHYLLIFMMPYLFSASLSLKKITINPYARALIGLMAGIGFSLKPHFLPALILVESYFIYRNKNIFGWLRIESAIIILFGLFYFISVVLFYPEYFKIILPLWFPFYFAVPNPWKSVLTQSGIVYCYSVVLYYLFTRQIDRYSETTIILFLAMLGMMVSYIVPKVLWYYHVLPAVGIGCVLTAILYGQIAQYIHQHISTIYNKWIIFIVGLLVFFLPLTIMIKLSALEIEFFHNKTSNTYLSINYFKKSYQGNTYLYLSPSHGMIYFEYYAGLHFVGSFPYTVWEYQPDVRLNRNGKKISDYQKIYYSYALKTLTNDLNLKKPDMVVVDNHPEEYLGKHLDYLKEYTKDPAFKNAWSHYKLLRKFKQDYFIFVRKNNL
jgi:hypothetical protein